MQKSVLLRKAAIRPLVLLLIALLAGSAFASPILPGEQYVPGEALVKVRSGAPAGEMSRLEQLTDSVPSREITRVSGGTIWLIRSRSMTTDALVKAIGLSDSVLYAEPNYILRRDATPTDTHYGALWALRNTGQQIGSGSGVHGADISAEAAWDVTTGSRDVVIGVVDTGVDYTHPDLAANIWSNPGGKGNSNCAAGTHGFNAINSTCDPMDDEGHGTHVAGTIGAVGNDGVGVAGVAWTTSIMALKFIGSDGRGSTADAIAAIDFAVQAKIDGVNVRVLSNSWGKEFFSKALLDEINKANENDILFIASAGNDSVNNDLYPHYPSSYNTINMISVAATDYRDQLAFFSNTGTNSVHLGAPGVAILSSVPGSRYASFSGTSMSSPHVAGVAALVLAKTPSLTAAEVKEVILSSTDPIPALAGRTVTGGRLNAAKAVGAPPTPAFTLLIDPDFRTVQVGMATMYNLTIVPAGGFEAPVELSISGLPTGASSSFSVNPATSGSRLSVAVDATTESRTFALTVTATGGGMTRSRQVYISVQASASSIACPSFYYRSSYGNGPGPFSLASADFNRDGIVDIASVDPGWSRLMVRMGTGIGTLGQSFDSAVPGNPIGVITVDVNVDGIADLVTANMAQSISVLLGRGDGTFAAPVSYPAGTSPFWVAEGDFNNDAKPDLAVADNGSSSVSILSGVGDGTFQSAVHFATGAGPFWVAISDFDRDGNDDLAVAASRTNEVSVLLGRGDGSFATAVAWTVGTQPSSLAAGDFNEDGKPDLAVANAGSADVSVLAGNGDGTFQPSVQFEVGDGPSSIAIADFTGDGSLDVVTANRDSQTLTVLGGTGTGSFARILDFPDFGYVLYQVIAADLNRDGKPDLAFVDADTYYQRGYINALLNIGHCTTNCGTIAAPTAFSAGTAPESIATADFNRDGRLDVVTANNGSDTISISTGNGDGTLAAPASRAAGSAPHAVAAADVSNDGRVDLIVVSAGANAVGGLLGDGIAAILPGNGDATFQSAVNYTVGIDPRSVAVADFNRDGRQDLVVANRGSNTVSILSGQGAGGFAAATSHAVASQPSSVVVADLNRDGKTDLAVAASAANAISIALGRGDGTFGAATNIGTGTTPSSVVAADFDGDGIPDLATANQGSNNVSVLLGNGDGTFSDAVSVAAGTAPRSIASTDLNDDGRIDLLVANHGSGNVSLLSGLGAGAFAAAVTLDSGAAPSSLAPGDFNGDGKADLAVTNETLARVSILLNSCPSPDLTITKTHSGDFQQGDSDRQYTIVVSNVGASSTSGQVAVNEVVPAGLTLTALSGTGWTCSLPNASCTRADALAGGSAYPALTATVRVASAAPPSVTNVVRVSGGGELAVTNNQASDTTTITAAIDLSITKTHAGDFAQGTTGEKYNIRVRNLGRSASTGSVTVTESLPAGLTATAMSGSGWNCTLESLSCTRSDSLAAETSYPEIAVTVDVAADAAPRLVNRASVSGGGDVNPDNNSAADSTTIWKSGACGGFLAAARQPGSEGEVWSPSLADVNGDGKIDMVGAAYRKLVVFPGNGDGTFAAPLRTVTETELNRLITGDFDNDGILDVAATAGYPRRQYVYIFRGRGDGTFAAATSFPTRNYPGELVAADLNDDGNLDAVVINPESHDVSVLLGNGSGSLGTAVHFGVNRYPAGAAIADVNGDGRADIVVTSVNEDKLSVLLGNGDGSFQPLRSVPAGRSHQVISQDLDEDGNIDLIATNTYSAAISIVPGNGDGTFEAPRSQPAPYGTSAVAPADVNGDGKADLILTGTYNGQLLLGVGDGTFQDGGLFETPGGAARVADLDGDGQVDLIVSGWNGLYVLRGGCADLAIEKTHSGDFYAGQIGRYTITVRNAGALAPGTVTVVDSLPTGLSLASANSNGWSCSAQGQTVTCTYGSGLPAGGVRSFELYVNVSSTAPSTVTNVATVSHRSDTNVANNTANDPTVIRVVSDLSITKTHSGTFIQGQSGRTYAITVRNVGSSPTSGFVVVEDYLPGGLTPISMAGAGWNCTLQMSCRRSDVLAPDTSYPEITVTVNVAVDAPPTVTNQARVHGGGELHPNSNNYAYDETLILGRPLNVTANPSAVPHILVTWRPVAHATRYEIWRSSDRTSPIAIGTTTATGFTDANLEPDTSYLYWVRAMTTSETGPMSAPDLATNVRFSDDPIVPGMTTVRASHVLELRTAVNAVRSAAGLPPATFSGEVAAGEAIMKIHITELRTYLEEARAALLLPSGGYSSLLPGSFIRAAHVQELRAATR